MHFFHAREAAEQWTAGRDALVALSLDEAFELAQAHWVERARRGEQYRSSASAT